MRNLEKSKSGQPFLDVFVRCAQGVGSGKLITRESRQDKEFHFQNWFRARLTETGFNFEAGGRNSYPDFRLVASTDGFEVKGLAYPGREANYDCNRQVPSGSHNGRTIYYVFGRYAFDTRANTLVPELVDNPSAGCEHSFSAFRLKGAGGEEVAVRPPAECSEARPLDEPDARVTWS
jgi:hypothetical protein